MLSILISPDERTATQRHATDQEHYTPPLFHPSPSYHGFTIDG
jgi:hypothetical protein